MQGPADSFLAGFVVRMSPWRERIRRACYADSVAFSREGTAVCAYVAWTTRGQPGSCKLYFSLDALLGHTRALHAHAWQLAKAPCSYAREIISGVLNQRGA